jgi:hypothetical protein
MATTVPARAVPMTLERVDAKLSLLGYEIREMTYVADRERAFMEPDRLLDIRLAIVEAEEA